jgi:hypothetical protein
MPKPLLPDDRPTTAHVGRLRSWLSARGVEPKIANGIAKTNRTMAQIANDLITYLASRKANK